MLDPYATIADADPSLQERLAEVFDAILQWETTNKSLVPARNGEARLLAARRRR